MGQENSSAFNCGIFERDHRTEVRGDQAIKIRKMLEQERMRYQAPSRDTDTTKSISTSQATPLREPGCKACPLFQHSSILRLSNQPFERCVNTEHGFYEVAGVSLASLVESRYNSKLLFPEEEVLALIESMAYALAYLESKRWAHHDVYPTNIYYADGVFKLAHPRFVRPSYRLTLERKRFSFLSPELIIALREEEEYVDPEHLYKSDVFSLGMALLEFCSLAPSCEVYDQDNYDIIDSLIQERLEGIKQRYSPKVAEAISAMLQYEVDERVGAVMLAKRINQELAPLNAQMEATKRVQQAVQSQSVPAQQAQPLQGQPGQLQGPQGMAYINPQKPQQHPAPQQLQTHAPYATVQQAQPIYQASPMTSPLKQNTLQQRVMFVSPETADQRLQEQIPTAACRTGQPVLVGFPGQNMGPLSYGVQQQAAYRAEQYPPCERTALGRATALNAVENNIAQHFGRDNDLLKPRATVEGTNQFKPDSQTLHIGPPPQAASKVPRFDIPSYELNSLRAEGAHSRASLQQNQGSSSDPLGEEYRRTTHLLAQLNIESKLNATTQHCRRPESPCSYSGKAEESLDERVRRILQKSKQIK